MIIFKVLKKVEKMGRESKIQNFFFNFEIGHK